MYESEPDGEQIEQLTMRAQQGDAKALEALLRQIEPDILRQCTRSLPHHHAEDACQIALIAIWTHITGFEGRSTLRTWIRTVAANAVRQIYRKLKQRSAEQPTTELPDVPGRRTTSMIAATKLDLLNALDHLERERPELVEPLVLRELAQLEYAEIAERLDLPLGTVKTHIHRGRRRLGELLAEGPA